jgi:WD40 repeat protein
MTAFIRYVMPLIGILATFSIAAHQSAHAADPKKAAKVTYEEHVLPILRDKCIGCHSPDKARSGLVVSTYPGIMAGGSSGEVIKPGDPDNSRLFLLVSHKQEPFMPPKSAMLPAENLETIRQWIVGGALENSGSKAKMINKPKHEIALSAINKGKPEGPPPMPSRHLGLEPVVHAAHSTAVTAIASSPWAPLVAVAGQKQVLLYHSDTLELLGVLPFPEGVPYVLKFSRNGSLLLAGGGRGAKSGRAVVWGVQTGERIFEVGDETDAVLAADISADQTQIALGGPGKIIRIFSTKDGQLIREIKKHTDWVTALEYGPDGVLLATGDRSGGLYIWEAYTGREYFSLRGHTASITDVSWRSDSNALASGSEDTTIRLWEMENGGQIKAWGAHGGGVESVRFARDGRITSCGRDQVTRVWDQNGAQQKIFEAFPDIALRTTFTHDGNRVVAGDWTGAIRVWNVADGKQAGLLSANPPGLAEQLEAATKELAALEAAQNKLAATAAASRDAAQKAVADLTATQKALADNAAAVKTATDSVNKAKDAAAKSAAAIPQAQAQVAAKDLSAKALAEAAAKVKDAAAKAKDNKALADEATKCQDLAAKAVADVAAAQKNVTDLTAAVKTATDEVAKAQQALTTLNSTVAALPKQVEAKSAAAKAAAAKAATDKAAIDQGAAALSAARARVDKLRAALQAAPAVARK